MIKNLRIIFLLITAFLFGISLNNKTSLFCILLFVLAVLQAGWKRSFRIRASNFSLSMIAVLLSYTVISFFHFSDWQQLVVTYFTLPLTAFLTGYFIVKMDNGGLLYKKVVIYISAGLFAFGILNIVQRYENGYNTIWWVASGRMCANYWTGYDMWPTMEATYFLPLSSLLFYALIINKNILLKLAYLAAFIATVWAALDIGSRAVIALPLVMCAILLLYYYKSSKFLQSKKAALFIKLFIAAFSAVILYSSNTAGIRDTVESSNLYSRMTGQTFDNVDSFFELNGRDVRYNLIFKEMPTHLFGGIDLGGDVLEGGLGSAHNTWLDIYRAVGIIPFLLFILCTVMLVIRMRFIIKTYSVFDRTAMPLLSVLIIINIQFLSESMFILNSQLMNFYFMLCGMIDCLYVTLRMKSEEYEGRMDEPIIRKEIGYGQSQAS